MKSLNFNEDFYIAITHLFYSFSMIDKTITIQEKKEIVWAIKEEWATNEYGFNSEELIYETMRNLINGNLSAEKAYDFFKSFFLTNNSFFNNEVNIELLDTCYKICNANNSKNKSELILLAKLQKLIEDRKIIN
ncbi:conserved protein of unknown function [Tenacibaculum sp. 190130A14a]|uniref:TerB family tellurite resistance protein n=1 Tax=Tenacibaculum polynesiense TaxID=3137857 RepID=A0ABM9PBR3_9FLAO